MKEGKILTLHSTTVAVVDVNLRFRDDIAAFAKVPLQVVHVGRRLRWLGEWGFLIVVVAVALPDSGVWSRGLHRCP
jgi:uncharacterized membrane protein